MLVPGNHEMIVSMEIFNDTQELLKNTRYRNPEYKLRHVLNGIIKCKKCGHSVRGRNGGSYNKTPYYGCTLKKLKFSDKFIYKDMDCDSSNIKGELLEKAVIKELKNIVENLNSLNSINYKEDKVDLKQVRKAIERLEQKKERILDAYIDGNLNKDIYQKRVSIIEKEILSLEKGVLKKQKNNLLQNNKDKIIEYFNELDMRDTRRANDILRLLIDKIVVSKNKGTAPDDFELEIYLNII